MTGTSCTNGPTAGSSNPLLSEFNTPFQVPPFDKIMAKDYLPALVQVLTDSRKGIEAIISDNSEPTFENTVTALDRIEGNIARISSIFYNQAQANTNDSLQKIEAEMLPMEAAFKDEIRLNADLFKRIRSVYDKRAELNLSNEQNFLLENLYKEFVRNGANLNEQDQDTLKDLNRRLSLLAVRYRQNILSETNSFKLFITNRKDLAGLPEAVISAAADEAKASGFEGKWAFTTKRPSIFPFLTYASNREKRKELFEAYIMRGNNGTGYDNNRVLAEIVKLRAQRARLLGYRNHSGVVLEPGMAKNPENVLKLLNNLWEKAIPVAVKDRDEMRKIVSREGGDFKIEPYDWWYYSEKLRKQKYDLDDTSLRPYFELSKVKEGAFAIAGKLFGITIKPLKDIPLPHPEAEAYEIKEADGSHIGILYMDFHPRMSKQQGAWCVTYRNHRIEGEKEITPVVTSVFNFTRPTGGTPALISLEEVSTLFHEFGHALDVLFNKAQYHKSYSVNVAWDFVELPAQIMEHWATEPEVLSMYARHYSTGEPIPDAVIEKIKKSGYFNQGFLTVEYLAAALLDIAYHTLEDPAIVDIQNFEKKYFEKAGLIPEIVPRYRSTYFLHIADGYDSGYYSYIWAAVLDNDAFEAFREKGLFDQTAASSLRKNILEKNGTMDAMEMFVNFRGREPVIGPLLKNRGLI